MAADALPQEERSKALFGNKHMLEVCRGIAATSGRFTALELSVNIGVGYSTTHRLLGALTKAGLVQRELRSPSEREQWYIAQRHRFWDAAHDLYQDPGTNGGKAAQ